MTAAVDVVHRLAALRDQGHRFPERTYFPRFQDEASTSYRRVTWSSSKEPVKYTAVFGAKPGVYDTVGTYSDLAAYDELRRFVSEQPALREYLAPDRLGDDLREHVLSVNVADVPLEMAERHLHIQGWTVDEDALTRNYQELETWWLNEELPVELIVPIVAVDFAADSMRFGDGSRVDRLSEGEQLVRWPGQRLSNGLDRVLAMSTHALVVPDNAMGNIEALAWLRPADAEVHNVRVERFFQALAAVTGAPSGYLQVLFRPLGWSPGYLADLPVLIPGPVQERFSARLDRRLSEPAAVVDAAGASQLQRAYSGLADEVSAELAGMRLLSAERRQSETDRILDLCIGIEALISDSSPGDTTYKLAVRTAAVLAERGLAAPSEFIDIMKRVYAHRSALVHGKRNTGKTGRVKLGEQTFSVEAAARFILRELLLARLNAPDLTPDEIDGRIIGGALDRWGEAHGS